VGSVGPAMCNPLETPVDPAVAAVLLSVCLSRAAQGVERLGRQAPPSTPAEAAPALQALGPLVFLRKAAARLAAAAKVLRKDGGRGTATLLRVAAGETVRRLPAHTAAE
jgi:hypothetical protein